MGILVPIVLMLPLVFKAIEKWLLLPIIRVEEWLIQKVFQCKKKEIVLLSKQISCIVNYHIDRFFS